MRATIHWVSAAHAVEAEVRLYNPLLMADRAEVLRDVDWALHLNPDSLEHLTGCLAEPGLRHAPAGARFHFDYFGVFSPVCAISCGAVKFRPQGGKALAAKKSAVRSGK